MAMKNVKLNPKAKVGTRQVITVGGGRNVTLVKTATGWEAGKPYKPTDPNAKTPSTPPKLSGGTKLDPTRPIGGGSAQAPPKNYLNMTRGEQDRAAAQAQTDAINKAKQDSENVRRSLIQDAYEEKGLTRSGNRKSQAPGLQPRDTEMKTLRENAKQAANEKFQAYLNEKTSSGKTRREMAGDTAAAASAAAGGKVKAVGPSFKDFGELAGKKRIKDKTVLSRAAKAFSGTNPSLKGKMSSAESKAYANTSLSKDEFNRFKNIYRRTHKNDNVDDAYLKVMARYVKSKGTKTKAFKTFKFKEA